MHFSYITNISFVLLNYIPIKITALQLQILNNFGLTAGETQNSLSIHLQIVPTKPGCEG